MKRFMCRGLLAALTLASAIFGAQAQTMEGGPLHLVVGYAAGGPTDRVARIVGDKLGAKLGVPVVVDNKPGAGGRLAAQQVKATPAGQNVLMVANPAVMIVAPLVFKDNNYDAERDFVPVSHVNDYEFALAVSTAVPVRELSHLLAWMRANPEKANFGVPATGSLPHFFGLMMGEKAKVEAQVIGYRGSGPLLTDLVGGQVPIAFDTFDVDIPQHQAGKIRILAMSGAKRSPFAPDVPTFKEVGLEPVNRMAYYGILGPKGLPKEVVDKISAGVRKSVEDPAVRKRIEDTGSLVVANTPEQFAAQIKAELEIYKQVVAKQKLTLE